jgi:hypothetical protein
MFKYALYSIYTTTTGRKTKTKTKTKHNTTTQTTIHVTATTTTATYTYTLTFTTSEHKHANAKCRTPAAAANSTNVASSHPHLANMRPFHTTLTPISYQQTERKPQIEKSVTLCIHIQQIHSRKTSFSKTSASSIA